MKFDFSEVIFLDIEKKPMTDEAFELEFRSDKRKLVANVLWRQSPNAEIADACLGILKGYATDISKESLIVFKEYIDQRIGAFPVKDPIIRYIDSILKSNA